MGKVIFNLVHIPTGQDCSVLRGELRQPLCSVGKKKKKKSKALILLCLRALFLDILERSTEVQAVLIIKPQ